MTAGRLISSLSTATVLVAAPIKARIEVRAFVGDQTRSAPVAGIRVLGVTSASNVASMAATSAGLVSVTRKSRVVG